MRVKSRLDLILTILTLAFRTALVVVPPLVSFSLENKSMKNRDPKPKGLIKSYSSAIVGGLAAKIAASSPLKHRLTKGELRELFTVDILNAFLTSQFSIGTGVIINQKEEQSNQTDIIIYDNRILPPFIKEQYIGVYPAESVVGTIEIKSILDAKALKKAIEDSAILHTKVYNVDSSLYRDYPYLKPLSGIVGFYGRGAEFLRDSRAGKVWLEKHAKNIFAICLVGEFCWLNLQKGGWKLSSKKKSFEETKRFLAVYLDNIRSKSEFRLKWFSQSKHYDWLSIYIRDQKLFEKE